MNTDLVVSFILISTPLVLLLNAFLAMKYYQKHSTKNKTSH